MSRIDPLEVDVLLDLAAAAGPGAATQLAYGHSLFVPEERHALLTDDSLVVGSKLIEAVAPLVDAMPRHDDGNLDTAIDLQDTAVEIGKLIPRLQLAIRATQDMNERAAIVLALDAALDAHRTLQEWSSRAAEYDAPNAEGVLDSVTGLLTMLQGLAARDHRYQ